MAAARRYATEYLEIETDSARREEIFAKLLAKEVEIRKVPESTAS